MSGAAALQAPTEPTPDELAHAHGGYLADYYFTPEERELRELKEAVRRLGEATRAPIKGARSEAGGADSEVDELLASCGYERAQR